MTTLILDDASNTGMASDLALLKLAREGKTLLTERESLTASTSDQLRSLKIGKRIREIAEALGKRPVVVKPAPAPEPAPVRTEPTHEFYPDEGKRTTTQRQKANNAAIALMREIQASGRGVTDEDRAVLAQYSGNGGGIKGADGKTGSPHEYYTPKPIAAAMWDLLAELGFAGGSVCDPSAGSGIFTATRPKNAAMSQIELDETSGTINGMVNNGPAVTTTVSPFEAIAANTPDEIYDAVITNVPFGSNKMRGDNKVLDPRFQDEPLEGYFVMRALQKVKPGGLAAFIVPKSIMSGLGAKDVKLRLNASLIAEFVGAYRLPNSVFTTAAADVTTDLIVFRKFARGARRKIEELESQNPALLREAGVLWDEFLDGKYFKGAGKRYVLGEDGLTTNRFGKDVAAVISDESIANIAKMIRRFGDSHINWALLNETETAPIVYSEGDVIHKDGQTLEFRDGEWVAMDSQAQADRLVTDMGAKVSNPLDAVKLAVSWDDAFTYHELMVQRSKFFDLEDWFSAAVSAIREKNASDRQTWWEAVLAGMSVMNLFSDADSVEPFDYKAAYPEVSALLAKHQAYANRSIGGTASRMVKDALQSIARARYKGEFSPMWLGEILANVETAHLTPTQVYEKVRYESENETGFVPVAKLREAFSDFDPIADDEWCVGADASAVMHANDYYTGSYGDFLKQANADLEAATDPDVRAKLMRQVERAKERINVVDVSNMTFNLFTPHVTMHQKLEFLQTYVSPDIFISGDEFDIKQASVGRGASAEDAAAHKAMQRFVKSYLKNQTITTGTRQADRDSNPDAEAALTKRIKDIADKAKAQFDSWARANEEIQVSLHQKLNDPANLKFIEQPDGTPLDIPNLNTVDFKPHTYQYAAARRYARHFGGVLGFDVGLGKTLTALATTQYAQSIGVKKKTIFVVPNATLTNWQKEAGKAYLDTSDCLFVGIVTDKKGKKKVDNAQVKIDLNMIRENRHAKIFMTIEAFKLIPLREETLDAYVEYLTANDDAYTADEDDKTKAGAIGQDSLLSGVKDMGVKSGALPYFEDLGVDSLVLDEAHNYKNSKVTSAEFTGAKYLSNPVKSQRGIDMQAKAWYVRGLSTRGDGVISLTATPITNSPLEVYSMLTLALGEAEVNAMYGVTGADSFMSAACDIDERPEENIVGEYKVTRTFTGLQNAGLLRRLLQTSAVIKTAEDVKADGVNISVPQSDLIATPVDIGTEAFEKVIGYKDEYLVAKQATMFGKGTPEEKLLASPFNLIRKMTRVINDIELDFGYTTFKYDNADHDKVLKAVEAFEKKNIREMREYVDPNADESDVTEKLVKDTVSNTSESKFMTRVRVKLGIANGQREARLLSNDYETQDVFLKLLDAAGITPGVKVSPKLAAVIANVKKEAAYPRHLRHAKQIIFCDELGLHHKIKLALVQDAGIPASKIKIVNAVAVDVAGMQDVQDGFNADGEDNKYEYVIANKKAEVGINLQKGCQAIHHMTIGWTPDSTHQRNGRGVRQGNPVEKVMEYHYDANGTFDSYKRKIVDIKSDWIGALMKGDGGKVKIDNEMNSSDYELLANAMGDAEAMAKVEQQIAERALREKQAATRVKQIQYIHTITAAEKWLSKNGIPASGNESRGFNLWVNSKISALRAQLSTLLELQAKRDESESALMRSRLQRKYDELKSKFDIAMEVIGGLATPGNLPRERQVGSPLSATDLESKAYANWKKDLNIQTRMRDESEKGFRTLTDDGYSGDALEAFKRGDAQVLAGVLVPVGAFAQANGKLYVVRKGVSYSTKENLYAYDPETRDDIEILKLLKPVFTEKASARWRSLVEEAAKMDEATIAANPHGFASGDPRLYMSFVDDVRLSITVPIPSVAMSKSSFTFARPVFPIPLADLNGSTGGALVARIRAEQMPLLDLSAGESWRGVKPRDMRNIGPALDSVKEQYEAVRDYCMAHRLRATEGDLDAIQPSMSIKGVFGWMGTVEEFFKALPQAVASYTSPEELDAWSLAWFSITLPWIDLEGNFADALGAYHMQTYRRQQAKLDDGRERWVQVVDDVGYTLQDPAMTALEAAMSKGLLVDAVLEEAGSGYVANYMPSGFLSMDGNGRKIAEVLCKQTGDYIELAVGADKLRTLNGYGPSVRFFFGGWGDVVSAVATIFSSKWANIVGWAKKARAARAVDAAGVDVPGILAELNTTDGIISARVGDADLTEPNSKGSVSFKSGTYLNVKIQYMGRVSKLISFSDTPLEGRVFSKTDKTWRFPLQDGVTFAKGGKVATIEDFFKHIGLDFAKYRL